MPDELPVALTDELDDELEDEPEPADFVRASAEVVGTLMLHLECRVASPGIRCLPCSPLI